MEISSRALCVLGLIMCAANAEAAELGFYVGAGIGSAEHDLSDGGAEPTILVGFSGGPLGGAVVSVPRNSLDADGDGTGWKAAVGYRFHRYLAAEVEYLDLGGGELRETFEVDFPFGGSDLIERTYSTDVSGPALSLLASLPVGGRFEAIIRAGVLFVDTEVTFEQFNNRTTTYGDRVFVGGLGVVWNFDEHWSARLEYQKSDDIDSNPDLAASRVELSSASVVFRF